MRSWRMRENQLKKMMVLAGAAVALMSLEAILPQMIKAEVRVKARIHTPNLDVEVRSGRDHARGQKPRWARPIQHRRVMVQPPAHIPITRKDRKIAKRLAKMTGYRQQLLLDLRRDGLRWQRIAAILEIPPRMLRVAMRGRRGHRGLHFAERHEPLPPRVIWVR